MSQPQADDAEPTADLRNPGSSVVSAGPRSSTGLGAVFIGGTGRSGTTILAKLLGAHRDFVAFRDELRFLTDPDGIIGLKRGLVDDWSPFFADVSLSRFEALMADLERRFRGRYPTVGLGSAFGRLSYRSSVRAYVAELRAFAFRAGWAGRTSLLDKLLMRALPFQWWRRTPFVATVQYQGPLDEECFLDVTRAFLGDLMGERLSAAGRRSFVDHTPMNVVHADFLIRLLPRARFLHIRRDLRDVVASYCRQDWGPTRPEHAARIVRDVLNRWEVIRRRLPPGSYLEIRFEDLIEQSRETLGAICRFLEVDVDPAMLEIDLSRHHIGRWKRDGIDPLDLTP